MSVSGGHHSFYHVGCVVTFGTAWRGRVMARLSRKQTFVSGSLSPLMTLCVLQFRFEEMASEFATRCA
jgi:hypothetical protein